MEIKKREYWVDIAKGIGIILVMFGHTAIGPSILKYTYIFNMPGFLFLSGYFLNINKFANFKDFFKAKAKAILIPYLGLSIISIVFYKFYYQMPLSDFKTMKDIIIIFFKATRTQIFYNIPLWFLPTLFFIENTFYLIRKINKKWLEWIIILVLGSYFVIKWDTLYNPKLIWTIDSGLFYLIFFSLGYYLKQGLINIKINKWIAEILATVAVLINTLAIYNSTLLDKIFRNEWILNHGIIYFISLLILAFSGIYVITSIAKIIKRQKILEFLGRNSLSFFGLHVLFFWTLDKILKPMPIFQDKLTLLSIIYVVITTIAIIVLMPYLKKWLPKVFGKN